MHVWYIKLFLYWVSKHYLNRRYKNILVISTKFLSLILEKTNPVRQRITYSNYENTKSLLSSLKNIKHGFHGLLKLF